MIVYNLADLRAKNSSDCSSPIIFSRLVQIYCSGFENNIKSGSKGGNDKNDLDEDDSNEDLDWKDHFHHLTTPTLAHLLALFLHPPKTSTSRSPTFLPPKTALLVIDSISTVFDDVYRQDRSRGRQQQQQQQRQTHSTSSSVHSAHDSNTTSATSTRSKPSQPHSQTRNLILLDLIVRLSSLAALHNIAVVYTSQTATRLVRYGAGGAGDAGIAGMSGGVGAVGGGGTAGVAPSSASLAPVPTLCPVLGGGNNAEWHASVAVRIVLFRDWIDGYVYARKRKVDNDEKSAISSPSLPFRSGKDKMRGHDVGEEQQQQQQQQQQGEANENIKTEEEEEAEEVQTRHSSPETARSAAEGTKKKKTGTPNRRKCGKEEGKRTNIMVRDARYAAVLKVRYIPLIEDAALRRAVCFDVDEVRSSG